VVPGDIHAAAFRIVQEALTNVLRHTGPTTATVRISYGDQNLTVEIDDDGHGPGVRPTAARVSPRK
jgi:signal transduction histidine kinase